MNKQKSLRVALLQMVLIPALGVIIILVGLLGFSAYVTQSQIVEGQQNLINALAQQSTQYLTETRQLMQTLAYSLLDLDLKEQEKLLSQVRANYPRFTAIYLLNRTGRVVAESTDSLSLMDFSMTGEIFFKRAQSSREPFFSDPFISPTTGQVSTTGVVPIYVDDKFSGALVGELNLDTLQQVIESVKLGEEATPFMVDHRGILVAHPSAEWVQQQRDMGHLTLVQAGLAGETNIFEIFYDNDQKNWFIGSSTAMPNEWLVIITQPAFTAARPLIGLISVSGLVFLLTLILFALNQSYSLRRVTRPISALVDKADRLAGGNYEILAAPQQVSDFSEITSLEQSFSGMVKAVQERDRQLEQRVMERTRRLELIAILGERLSAILNLDELLSTMVNQVKQNFGYYHVQVYLLDDKNEDLVLVEGTGSAGAEMKAHGHHISLQVPTSLVAQAARDKQIVRVDNVRESSAWLPNPLLPDTQAEMAVPIITENRVVGVLDVQEDKLAGLDESDASLLRSLANQVAIALANARLFEQTIRSKEEAEQARKEIETSNRALETQMWQTTGQTQLNDKMRGEQGIPTLASNVIQQLCKYLDAPVGTLYMLEGQTLRLAGSYAYTPARPHAQQFHLGESLVGQAALEKQSILLNNIPSDYITISSSLGETQPRRLLVTPFTYNGHVIGVIELGTLAEFSPIQEEFLRQALEGMAIAFTTAQARHRVNELLEETRQQAEELQAQEEELRAANEELESQAESLRASETKLRANQEKLEETNTELEEKAEALEKNSAILREQQVALDRQNRELKTAQQELEHKAQELALASKYKSEFLANMSHELRTPLNSLLILAGMLSKNEDGNLTADQVESMQIIHNGGTDLLNLINDILDLSKIEAGKVEFRFAPLALERLTSVMQAQFSHVAESKGLAFEISLAEDVPDTIETDQQRVEQIVKNLLSNAFKFTPQGSVRLDIYRPQPETKLSKNGLDPARAIAIRVSDTGIGMTPAQQQIVFEAFQQADSSTSRQYGGTGLGLSISRELVSKLGGQIDLVSEKGQGSTFTLYLPIEQPKTGDTQRGSNGAGEQGSRGAREQGSKSSTPPPFHPSTPPPPSPALADDRNDLQPGDRVLLIIEDDPHFAKVVADKAHKKDFKCLLAGEGQSGLHLAQTYPTDAIILDLNLPDLSGWEVLNALKDNPNTRHIPVHIMSAADEDLDAYKRGAMGFLTKPVAQTDLEGSFQKIEGFIAREIKSLLLVEDDANLRKSVRKLLEGNDIAITEADLGQTALDQLAAQHFDCMILDLSLPDISGFEVLNRLNADDKLSRCPVIVYTGKALTEEENRELLKYADSVIVKGVKSPERLIDETALFLHRVIANLPEDKQQAIKRLHDSEAVLTGKNVLIVDDDARNAFALSKLLSSKGLRVYIAPGGQKALELLDKMPMDLVLMDIMMPGIDGYETTRQIRAQYKFRTLPVLALTAKAMKGDREKCIEAGASDYLSKPIDPDRLFSMLRVWLSRE